MANAWSAPRASRKCRAPARSRTPISPQDYRFTYTASRANAGCVAWRTDDPSSPQERWDRFDLRISRAALFVRFCLKTVLRSGRYFRVVDPDWSDPADTTFSRAAGGRWNPPATFGALYLNSNESVAAANARARHAKRAIQLFDLLPEFRPQLVTFTISDIDVLDALTSLGIADIGFAESFPFGVSWDACQSVALQAHEAGLRGVAARSAAECTATFFHGEELALFDDSTLPLPTIRRAFADWYPDPIPG